MKIIISGSYFPFIIASLGILLGLTYLIIEDKKIKEKIEEEKRRKREINRKNKLEYERRAYVNSKLS